MGWISTRSIAVDLFRICVVSAVAACGAGDTKLDPGDLELRDLLGVAPDTAAGWDAEQRASARHVLEAGFDEQAELAVLPLGQASTSLDDRIARSLLLHDSDRAHAGDPALGVVRIEVIGDQAATSPRRGVIAARVAAGEPAPAVEVWLSDKWTTDLAGRGTSLFAALAMDAGHTTGPVVVVPSSRLPVIAGYVASAPPRLLVNPVLLAALDPSEPTAVEPIAVAVADPSGGTPVAARAAGTTGGGKPPDLSPPPTSANPYSFYGSIGECAFAQRTRCDSCIGTGTCEAITSSADGDAECATLAENNGRGYFLICANLALAIVAVERCAGDAAPGCPRDVTAASNLAQLENNASFVDDATCGGALDGCLGDIYGAPPEPFPGVDAGTSAPRPPRETNVSCNDSCSSDNNNCEANPSCGEGPSCNNSLSCDSACSSSNDQSGCEGNCNACSEDSSGSGGSEGCGGNDGGGDSGSCGSDSGSDSGGSCGGNDNGGGGCGGDSGGGGGCGGDSGGGGGCGGDSGGGGGCGGGSSGGGGGGGGSSGGSSSSCNASRRDSSSGGTLAMSLVWALMPIPAAALVRRRSKKQARKAVQS
ncbi:MAG: hypothetical protein ABI867_18050 [Kofleriaceae bacterium]